MARSVIALGTETIDAFCKQNRPAINGHINSREVAICRTVIQKKKDADLASVTDVNGHYLSKEEVFHCEAGLKIEKQTVEGLKEVLIPAAMWLAPSDIVVSYPGVQRLIGMILTCVKKTNEGLVPFEEDKLYQQVKFQGLTPAALSLFAGVVIGSLGKYFESTRNTGNGREFINELFSAVGRLSKEEYIAMHWQLAMGPFNECFEWGVLRNGTMKSVKYSLSQEREWYIMSVKKAYATCFMDAKGTEAAKEFTKMMGYDLGAIMPIFVQALPIKCDMPSTIVMPKLNEFMSTSRAQRQADEKGLSAFSSGVGACGNPTKIQLRWNKKLSLILGELSIQKKSEKLIIIDDAYSELPAIHSMVQRWIVKANATIGKNYVFYLPMSKNTVGLEGYFTTSTTWSQGDRVLILSKSVQESSKEKEWSKVDVSSLARVKSLMGDYADMEKAERNDVHVTIMMHIMSDQLFRRHDPTQNRNVGWYIYNLGSIHNMYGILSTRSKLPLGSSDGTKLFQFATKMADPLTIQKFGLLVVQHNIARSGFMIYGQYYFNPLLNLLRHLPGKRINFVEGTLDDIGIDLVEHLEATWLDGDGSGSFSDEEEDVSEDENQPANTLTVSGGGEHAKNSQLPLDGQSPLDFKDKMKPRAKKHSTPPDTHANSSASTSEDTTETQTVELPKFTFG
jgi:hypothetical protein